MILVVTLLAVALGGSTELWEQALLALLTAGIVLIAPPNRSLSPLPTFLFVALFLLSLAAFLPAAWSPALPWRNRLLTDLHLSLPTIRTPQPWLTLQACCLLLVGLVWACYVLGQRWTSETRSHATRFLVCGVALLAAMAVAAFVFDFRVPNWNQEENRGWFPNRNQTADVLALCAVVNYALVFDSLRKRRASLYLWLCTLAILGAALVISYSRAGILMFFGGIALWHLWPTQRPKGRSSSTKWTALSLALVFVLLTLFFLYGGDTLQRFEGPLESSQDNYFRWAIQQDALHFSLQSPVLGVGLGNFEPLFASARQASVNADRAIHPESDWLWAACEMGWFAPILFVIGIGWWLRKCLPFELKSGESLRRALTVAGLLFVLHGFVDVSAHRLGSLCVGLLICSLALPSASPNEIPPWRAGALAFRILALIMILVSGWWLASVGNAPVPPTTADLDRIAKQIDQARAHKELATMESLATAALQIAPLNWHLYFQRAYAETFQPGELVQATNDFMVARGLESKWVKPCFDEGATWLAAGQLDLCMDAWEEALRRETPAGAPDLYREMLNLAGSSEMVHADLMALAAGKIDYRLVFLDAASPEETKKIVADVLAEDPDLHALDQAQREKLFAAWWDRGDREELVTDLTAHPDWLKAGWFFQAQSYAGQKDFQGAWSIVERCAPAPMIPAISSQSSLADLQNAFAERSDNLSAGILLYLAQAHEGHLEDAITTLRILEKDKNCPKYVFYLEAKLWAQKQNWELAWTAWWNYHET